MQDTTLTIKISNNSFRKLKKFIEVHSYKCLLKDKDMYEIIKKWFSNEVGGVTYKLCFASDNDEMIININKVALIYGLSRQVLFKEEREKYKELADLISYESFKKYYQNRHYSFDVNGKNIKIPLIYFINFLEMDSDEFETYINSNCSLDKDILFYGLRDFYRNEFINYRYLFPENIKLKIKIKLLSNQYLDLSYLEFFNNDNNVKKRFDNIKIDEEYLKYLLNDIDKYPSKLEKAICVYIRMCKSLTYNEEAYALNGGKKQADYSEIDKINLINNEVVCFDFNAIFGKVLSILGIEYLVEEVEGHSVLTFSDGKYLVEADAISSIFYGDIFACKVDRPIRGLSCKNYNNTSIRDFNRILVQASLLEYGKKKFTSNLLGERKYNLSIEDKLTYFYDLIDNCKFKKMDLLSFIQCIKREIFTEEELNDKMKILYVGDVKEPRVKANIIFVYNKYGIKDNSLDNSYFFKENSEKIKKLDKEDLEKMINMGRLREIHDSRNDKFSFLKGVKRK